MHVLMPLHDHYLIKYLALSKWPEDFYLFLYLCFLCTKLGSYFIFAGSTLPLFCLFSIELAERSSTTALQQLGSKNLELQSLQERLLKLAKDVRSTYCFI